MSDDELRNTLYTNPNLSRDEIIYPDGVEPSGNWGNWQNANWTQNDSQTIPRRLFIILLLVVYALLGLFVFGYLSNDDSAEISVSDEISVLVEAIPANMNDSSLCI